jgi:predicted  nucleic acid-binding Zn-ribbon protein
VQSNNESMGELSEILKNLVQEPITSLYQDNVSEDIKKIQRKLNEISAVDKKLSAIKTELDERFEEVEVQVSNVIRLNDTLVSKVNDISPKLAAMGVESQRGFDKASKQVGDVITQNDSLSAKLDTVPLKLVNISDVCGRVLEKSVETDKQLEKMLTGSEKYFDAISALNQSVDHSYSNLDKTIGTQNKEVLELLEDIGRIDNNTNETKALVDQLIQSNEILSNFFKESTVRDELLRKCIRNNRWVVVIGTLLISSIIVVFEMNLIAKI